MCRELGTTYYWCVFSDNQFGALSFKEIVFALTIVASPF